MSIPNKKWADVVTIISGKNQKSVIDPSRKYPIYGSSGIIGYANDFLCKAGTTIVGRKGTINAPIYVAENFWNIDTAFGISPGDELNPKYLFYFCMSFNFKALDKSTTIPSLAKRDLLAIEMPVPSLDEQARIVARIEELFSQLDSGVETLKTVKQQLAVYRQAVLKKAFDGIEKFAPLCSLSERIFDGPFGSNLKTVDYTSAGVRVVRLENLKDGWFDDSKQSFVTEEKYTSISNHTVYPSDVIMSTFIADSIKVCQMPIYIGYAVNKADCIGIRLKNGVLPRYVMYYLMTKSAYNSLVHQVHGATRPRVSTKQIKNIQIPICDTVYQIQVIQNVESRLSVCDSIEKTVDSALRQAEAMRQSILKQEFEGRMI